MHTLTLAMVFEIPDAPADEVVSIVKYRKGTLWQVSSERDPEYTACAQGSSSLGAAATAFREEKAEE